MRFMIIDTCEIIMNNHTCEINFISSAETFKNSLIIHEYKTLEIHA